MKKKIIFITLFLLIIDIITKVLIDASFNLMETKEIIIDFFSLTKIYNTGASWNILAGYQIVLILITLIVLVLLVKYQKKFVVNKRNILAFSLLYSGIIGNLLNRIMYGHVIDFLDFKIFGYDFPVFNFADIYIVIGIILIILAIYKKEDECGINS